MTEPLTPEQLRAIAHLSKYDIFHQGSAESAVQLLLREVERLKQELSATHQVIDALNIASANASEQQAVEIAVLQKEIERLRGRGDAIAA